MDLAWVLLFTLIFGLKGKKPIELSSLHASQLVIFGMQESARITTYYHLIFFFPLFNGTEKRANTYADSHLMHY